MILSSRWWYRALAITASQVAFGQVFPESAPHFTLNDNTYNRGDSSSHPCSVCESLTYEFGPLAPGGWTADAQFNGLIVQKVTQSNNVDADGVTVARQLVCRMHRYASELQQGKIHVVLEGLAHCPPGGSPNSGRIACLFDAADEIPWNTNNFPPDPSDSAAARAPNPWMTHAADRLESWVTDFAEEYVRIATTGILDPNVECSGEGSAPCNCLPNLCTAQIGGATVNLFAFPIDRLFIDSEFGMEQHNDTVLKVMKAETGDSNNRWSEEPVPGYDGQTLAQLWAAAEYEWDVTTACYAWNEDFAEMLVSDTEHECYDTFNAWQHARRRRPMLWYNSIATRAKRAIIEAHVYAPARDILSDLGTTPLTGNYRDIAVDGEADTFGWQLVRSSSADPNSNSTSAPPLVPSNQLPRFQWQSTNEASRLISYGDLGTWYNWTFDEEGASIDQPPMYHVNTTSPYYNHNLYMLNLYHPDHPQETAFESQLRVNRHQLEAAINSFGGGRQSLSEPYVPMPETTLDGVEFTRDMVREILAMLRAKQVEQVFFFRSYAGDGDLPSADAWASAREVYRQAYAYKINDWGWDYAVDYDHSVHYLGDVTNTLRAPENNSYGLDTVLIGESDYDTWSMTEASCKFIPWESAPGQGLEVIFECSIEIPDGDPIADPAAFPVYGELYLWDFTDTSHQGGWWRAVEFGDDGYEPTHYLFGTTDLSTRRPAIIPDGSPFIGSAGEVRLKFRHSVAGAYLPIGYFRSKYDLVQVLRRDTQIEEEEDPESLFAGGGMNAMSASVSGPDVNHDGVVDSSDLVMFTESLVGGAGLADYDGDGEVTAEDTNRYLTDYSQGG